MFAASFFLHALRRLFHWQSVKPDMALAGEKAQAKGRYTSSHTPYFPITMTNKLKLCARSLLTHILVSQKLTPEQFADNKNVSIELLGWSPKTANGDMTMTYFLYLYVSSQGRRFS
jgi:hypothetical protein